MIKTLFIIFFVSRFINCREIINSDRYFHVVDTDNSNNSDEKSNIVLNDRPVIGVLAQEISRHLNTKYPGEYKSYIAASYVKFAEGAGARVVPIW